MEQEDGFEDTQKEVTPSPLIVQQMSSIQTSTLINTLECDQTQDGDHVDQNSFLDEVEEMIHQGEVEGIDHDQESKRKFRTFKWSIFTPLLLIFLHPALWLPREVFFSLKAFGGLWCLVPLSLMVFPKMILSVLLVHFSILFAFQPKMHDILVDFNEGFINSDEVASLIALNTVVFLCLFAEVLRPKRMLDDSLQKSFVRNFLSALYFCALMNLGGNIVLDLNMNTGSLFGYFAVAIFFILSMTLIVVSFKVDTKYRLSFLLLCAIMPSHFFLAHYIGFWKDSLVKAVHLDQLFITFLGSLVI